MRIQKIYEAGGFHPSREGPREDQFWYVYGVGVVVSRQTGQVRISSFRVEGFQFAPSFRIYQ